MSENSKSCAPRIEKLLQVIALSALLLLSAGAARAQEAPTAESHDTLHLLVGRSLVINSPTRIRRLSIADPNIADALLINP
ncbi:MAG: pilus assembly protein N-terminal domain-containing protein, partial [Candidatus Acidiferrales bacterium]